MGSMQRDKGAAYEREVAHELTKQLGMPWKRVLGQARDGGGDVESAAVDVLVEAKRRKALKCIYEWMRQAELSATVKSIVTGRKILPAVVFRADDEKSLLIINLADLAEVMSEMIGDA